MDEEELFVTAQEQMTPEMAEEMRALMEKLDAGEMTPEQFVQRGVGMVEGLGFDVHAMAEQTKMLVQVWENASEWADKPHERIGISPTAMMTAVGHIVEKFRRAAKGADPSPEEFCQGLLVVGILTGIEWQEQRHA